MKQGIKVPETFIPEKKLEEKIEKLAKKIEEKESNTIMSTNCCRHGNSIILKFEKENPIGIICGSYIPKSGNNCRRNFETCRYISGFDPLQPNPDDEYKK